MTSGATRSISSADRLGSLTFFLQRSTGGVYVERKEEPRRGARVVQQIHFSNALAFAAWLDDDAVRFEHPQLYADVRRAADELWFLPSGSDAA